MLICQEIVIQGGLFLGRLSILQGKLYHDNPSCKIVCIFPIETEYIAIIEVCQGVSFYKKNSCKELGLKQERYVVY